MTEEEWAKAVNLHETKCCEVCKHSLGMPEAMACGNPKAMAACGEEYWGPRVTPGAVCDWFEEQKEGGQP